MYIVFFQIRNFLLRFEMEANAAFERIGRIVSELKVASEATDEQWVRSIIPLRNTLLSFSSEIYMFELMLNDNFEIWQDLAGATELEAHIDEVLKICKEMFESTLVVILPSAIRRITGADNYNKESIFHFTLDNVTAEKRTVSDILEGLNFKITTINEEGGYRL